MTGRLVVGAIVVATGVAWLLSAAGVFDLSYRSWVGVLLIAIGLTLVVLPGRHGGLVLLGILVALAGVPALLVSDEVLSGGVGDRREAPESGIALEPFRHGIGKLTVDLTEPDLELEGRRVEASIGIGDLLVIVPDDANVALDAHVGIGNAQAFGRSQSGIGADLRFLSGTSGRQTFDLRLEAGIGNVRVERR